MFLARCSLLALLLSFLVILSSYLHTLYPYHFIEYWNYVLEWHFADAPIMMPADDDGLTLALNAHFEDIMTEVNAVLQKSYEDVGAENTTSSINSRNRRVLMPLLELDGPHQVLTHNSTKWKTLWLKLYDMLLSYNSASLPTLHAIAARFSNVSTMFVSIMEPGFVTPRHAGASKGLLRFHWGMDIPEGNCGLELEGRVYHWQNKSAFLWDDTRLHRAWNLTPHRRLVLFVDVHRQMTGWIYVVNSIVEFIIRNTKHLQEMRSRIENYQP